jgi:outer membrane autotransporter protein
LRLSARTCDSQEWLSYVRRSQTRIRNHLTPQKTTTKTTTKTTKKHSPHMRKKRFLRAAAQLLSTAGLLAAATAPLVGERIHIEDGHTRLLSELLVDSAWDKTLYGIQFDGAPQANPTAIDAVLRIDESHVFSATDGTFEQSINIYENLAGAILLNPNTVLVLQNNFYHKKENESEESAKGGAAILVQTGAALYVYGEGSIELKENSADYGGAIDNYGTVTLGNVSFISNIATYNAGAIFNEKNARMTLTNALFTGNKSISLGGAVRNEEDVVFTMNGGSFVSNDADNGSGGAIISFGGAIISKTGGILTLREVLFETNSAGCGGAIVAFASTVTISDSVFTSNRAISTYGGAIYSEDSTLTINNVDFVSNTANGILGVGGAIAINSGKAFINNATFTGNSANQQGGAISAQFQNITDVLEIVATGGNTINFTENTAMRGGAIHAVSLGSESADSPAQVTLSAGAGGISFLRNSATNGNGGAIHMASTAAGFSAHLEIFSEAGNIVFDANSAVGENHLAGGSGGAIGVVTTETEGSSAAVEIRSNGSGGILFKNNTATFRGGAIFVTSQRAGNIADVTLVASGSGGISFENNTAFDGGGAIFALADADSSAHVSLTSGSGGISFINNSATSGTYYNGRGGAILLNANAQTTGSHTTTDLSLLTTGAIVLDHNTSVANGGAICVFGVVDPNLIEVGVATTTTAINLHASGSGGITITNNSVNGDNPTANGGAILGMGVFTSLSIRSDGGAIDISGNSATGLGGAIVAASAALQLSATGEILQRGEIQFSLISGPGGASITNNLAGTRGGAISFLSDVGTFTLTLDARKGDIVFSGNRQNVTLSSPYFAATTGTPNAINIANATFPEDLITFAAGAGKTIAFFDPISSANPVTTIAINRIADAAAAGGFAVTGGTVQFDRYASAISGGTTVHGGVFYLSRGASYGDDTPGNRSDFTLAAAATLKAGRSAATDHANVLNATGGVLTFESGSRLVFDLGGFGSSADNTPFLTLRAASLAGQVPGAGVVDIVNIGNFTGGDRVLVDAAGIAGATLAATGALYEEGREYIPVRNSTSAAGSVWYELRVSGGNKLLLHAENKLFQNTAVAWAGGGGVWQNDDGASAAAAAPNWAGDIEGHAVRTFVNGDSAVFARAGAFAVNVGAAGVAPATVSVNTPAAADSVTFSGGEIHATGAFTKTGAGTLFLGAKTAAAGGFHVAAGTLVLASADVLGDAANGVSIAAGANLAARGSGDWHFANPLSGAGTFAVELAADAALTFAPTAGGGGAFTGAVEVARGQFVFDATAAALLQTAALKVAADGVAQIAVAGATVRELALNGGVLRIDADGASGALLTAGTFSSADAAARIQIAATLLAQVSPVALNTFNIFDADFAPGAGNQITLVRVTGANGVADGVSFALLDAAGAPLASTASQDLYGVAGVAGKVHYGAIAVNSIANGGIVLGYGAVRIESTSALQDGGGVTLSAAGASDNTLSAALEGTGDFVFSGGTAFTLLGGGGYTGQTRISGGTRITAGVANAFGATVGLAIEFGSGVHLGAGGAQTVNGAIFNRGEVTGSGAWKSVTLSNDGAFAAASVIATSIENGEDGAFAAGMVAATSTVNTGSFQAQTLVGSFTNHGTAALGRVSGEIVNTGELRPATADAAWDALRNNGGTLDFGSGATGGHILTISTLSADKGTRGIVRLNVDLSNPANTDKLVVTGDIKGAHHFILNDITVGVVAAEGSAFKITVVEKTGADTNLADETVTGELVTPVRIHALAADGTSGYVVGAFTGYTPAVQSALNTAAAAGLGWFAQLDALEARMRELRTVGDRTFAQTNGAAALWLQARARRIEADPLVKNAGGFDADISGGDVGGDYEFATGATSRLRLGAFAGWQHTRLRFHDGFGSSGTADDISLGAYAAWFHDDGWFADANLKWQYSDAAWDARLHADSGGGERHGAGLALAFGKKCYLGSAWFLEPEAQLAVAHFLAATDTTQNGLHLKTDAGQFFRATAALRTGKTFDLGTLGFAQPVLRLGVSERIDTGGNLRAGDEKLSPDMGGLSVEAGFGVTWQFANANQLTLEYDCAYGEKSEMRWAVNLAFRRRF